MLIMRNVWGVKGFLSGLSTGYTLEQNFSLNAKDMHNSYKNVTLNDQKSPDQSYLFTFFVVESNLHSGLDKMGWKRSSILINWIFSFSLKWSTCWRDTLMTISQSNHLLQTHAHWHSAGLHPESDACCQDVFKHLPVTGDKDGVQVGGGILTCSILLMSHFCRTVKLGVLHRPDMSPQGKEQKSESSSRCSCAQFDESAVVF